MRLLLLLYGRPDVVARPGSSMTVIIIFQTDTALGCVTVRRRISAHLSAFARSSALGLRCPFANKRRTVDRTYGQRNSEIGRMNKRVARIEMDFYYYTMCHRDVVSLCTWSPRPAADQQRRDVWYISHAELRYMVIIIFKIHRACSPAGRGWFIIIIIIINIFFPPLLLYDCGRVRVYSVFKTFVCN